MAKEIGIIQAQWGRTLSGIYAVKGGILNLRKIFAGEVQLTHAMDRQIVGEAMRTETARIALTGLTQSADFSGDMNELFVPSGFFRINSCVVFTGSGQSGDFTNVNVCIEDDLEDQHPIWTWGSTNGAAEPIRFHPASAGANTYDLFLPQYTTYGRPALQASPDPDNPRVDSICRIVLNGTTAAFGAGTRAVYAELSITDFGQDQATYAGRQLADDTRGLAPPSF